MAANPGGSVGTIYVEIDLDPSRYQRTNKQLYKDATRTSLDIEKNFNNMGIKSAAAFDLMRAKIINSYNMIVNSSKSTANDIIRAEQAKSEQLTRINEQQFGKQIASILNIKDSYRDLGIKSAAEFDLMRQKITSSYSMIAHSSEATADDIIRAEQAKNEQIQKLNEQQFGKQTASIFDMEKNYRNLGIKSAAEFDLMRQKIISSYSMIAHSSAATADDIIRAEQAKNDQLQKLNEEQYGRQVSLIENLKNHWLEIVGVMGTVYAVMRFERRVEGWLNEVDAIGKHADAIGISTKAFQEYQYVAIRAHISQERFNLAMDYFIKKVGELRYGTGELYERLRYIDAGFIQNIRNVQTTEEALDLYLKKLSQTTNIQDRAALSAAAFGRGGGVAMVEMIRDGYAEMDRMRSSAESLGVVLDDELIKKAEDATEQLKLMHLVLKTQLLTVFSELAPTISSAASELINFTNQTKEFYQWSKDHPWTFLFSGLPWFAFAPSIGEQKGEYEKHVAKLKQQQDSNKEVEVPPTVAELKKQAVALEKVQDIIDKLTLSDRELAIKKLNEQFADFRDILKDIPEVEQAFTLSMDAINEKFAEAAPSGMTEEQSKALKEVQETIDRLTLSDKELAIKKLNEQFSKFRNILKDFPEVEQAFTLSMDAINEKFAEVVPSGMTEEQVKAMEKINDIIDKFTLSDKELAIKKLNEQFADFRDILKDIPEDIPEVEKAFELAMDAIDKQFAESVQMISDEVPELQKIFDDLSSGITDSFTNAFRDILAEGKFNFEKLGKSIRYVFADVIADIAKQKFIQPAISGLMANLTGMPQGNVYPSNFVGPLPEGATYAGMGSQAMGGVGAGAMAYGATGSSMAGIGAGIGFMVYGPVGAAIGGGLGMLAEQIPYKKSEEEGPWEDIGEGAMWAGPFGAIYKGVKYLSTEHESKIPSIDLLYEVIDGEVNLIAEKWKNTSKNQEILDIIEQTLQAHVDFYDRILTLTKNETAKYNIGLSGRTGFDIQQGLNQDPLLFFSKNYQAMSAMSPLFAEEFKKTWQATIPGATSTVQNPIQSQESMLSQIESGDTSGLDAWLNQKIGYYSLGEYKHNTLSELLGKRGNMGEWSELFEGVSEKFYAIQNDFADVIGNAFLDSVDTTGVKGFGTSIKRLMYENIKAGIAQGFVLKTIDTLMQADTGMMNAFGLLQAYALGEGDVTEEQATAALDTAMSGLDATITKMSPLLTMLSDWLLKLADTLGQNTDATVQNTEAILGPIDSLLKEMQTGALAPAQSIEGMRAAYEESLLAAMGDSSKITEATQSARDLLEFSRVYGGFKETGDEITADMNMLRDMYAVPVSPATQVPANQNSTLNQVPDVTYPNERYSNPEQAVGAMTIQGTLRIEGNGMATIVGQVIRTDPDVRDEIRRI